MIYERDETGSFVIVRDIRETHDELVCASASSRYCLLATAGHDGTVVLWNLEKYAVECVHVVDARPVGIAFSPIHPIMMVVTEDGYISLFYVPPFEGKDKNKCFAKIFIA
jgi:WD40 repeat protein